MAYVVCVPAGICGKEKNLQYLMILEAVYAMLQVLFQHTLAVPGMYVFFLSHFSSSFTFSLPGERYTIHYNAKSAFCQELFLLFAEKLKKYEKVRRLRQTLCNLWEPLKTGLKRENV